MTDYTVKLSVNGWENLYTELRAAGYTGGFKPKSLTIVNNSATALYVHFTQNGATNPSTAADGQLVSTAGVNASFSVERPDLATCWLNTAGALDVYITVIGG